MYCLFQSVCVVCYILCLPLYLPSVQFQHMFLVPVAIFMALLVSTHRFSPASTFPWWFISCLPYTLWSAHHICLHPASFFSQPVSSVILGSLCCTFLIIKRLLGGARPHCWFCVWLLGPTNPAFMETFKLSSLTLELVYI